MKALHVLKETFLSSLPLAAIIVIVCVFVAPMRDAADYLKLIIGYAGVVIGQAVFLIGLDLSILPVGKVMGESLVKLKKAAFVIFFGLVFGLLAEAAEPAVSVFSHLTHMVMPEIPERLFIWIMATGIGVFVGLALYRIMKDISIKVLLTALYAGTVLLALFVPKEFVALAFDAAGATTGDVSVPFMLALGLGVAATMSRRKSSDDVFGIIGIASIGPILAVFLYGFVFRASHGGVIPPSSVYDPGASESFAHVLLENMGRVGLALAPVMLAFLPFQFFFVKLPKKEFGKILLGIIPVFVGLLFFLSSIDFGFAFAGKYIGEVFLAESRPEWFKWLLLLVGFVLGAAITLSEPAVTVLGVQLEKLTNGHIKKNTIRATLALAIGIAAVLSIIKIITQVNILWFLVPLYALALIMMKFSSKLFIGLAFDSGGVSSGSLTSAFLTPLTLGIAQAVAAASDSAPSLLVNGFGIIAFISVTPLIIVQGLGIIYDLRYKKIQKREAAQELEDLEELLPHHENEAMEVRDIE